MGHIHKNKNLEVQIDFPLEGYSFSRFDWTGKISEVKFKGIPLTSVEDPSRKNGDLFGRGFYNEFGIDTALGFNDAEIGGWFHKIGIGLLKKEDAQYAFNKPYEIIPAEFQTNMSFNSICITCASALVNGYAYELTKEIKIQDASFTIKYHLKNTGQKIIQTEEYGHNFTAINNDPIGEDYKLNFQFDLKSELFGETVNRESAVFFEKNNINFNNTPNQQFFFSNLTGGEKVESTWELTNHKTKIGIREKGNFQTSKINLWGWKHVICPELFFEINIAPGESTEWTRTYEIFEI